MAPDMLVASAVHPLTRKGIPRGDPIFSLDSLGELAGKSSAKQRV